MTFLKIIVFISFAVAVGIATYYYYPYQKLANDVRIDKLVVLKSKHKMHAYANGQLIKTYTIAIGSVPIGDKQYEGDHKTPEGNYFICAKNPNSGFHKNLGISYPNANDLAEARNLGRPTGGDVKIHGLMNGKGYIGRFHRWTDWTNGCIALTDEEMDDVYEHTAIGTPILIKP